MPKYMKKNAYLFVYPMLTIAVIGIMKYLYVNFSSILLAFSIESKGQQVYTFANFETLFLDLASPGSGIWQYLGNTIQYFVMYMLKTLISFSVAYFLYKNILGYKVFRVVFYLPCIVSPIIFVSIWKNMLESSGLIGQLFGAGYINPLTDTSTATLTIVLYSFWGGFGTSLLVFVGAMNRVPSEVIDAGQIDGCGMGREFFSIIVPMVWETLSTMLLLTSMSVFTATGPILYFTRGNFETKTLSFFIFFETYNGSYNYPSAVGMFFTMIALPIVAFGRWLMNRANAQVQY